MSDLYFTLYKTFLSYQFYLSFLYNATLNYVGSIVLSIYFGLIVEIKSFNSLPLIAAGIVLEEKNWPPFFPIIHHDIANEIPIHLQRLQYVAFTTYLGWFVYI